jgi:hypothetical protein
MKVSRALKTLINKLGGRRPFYENDSIEQMQEEEQDALEE